MHFWAKMNGFTAALFIGMVLKMFLKPGLAACMVDLELRNLVLVYLMFKVLTTLTKLISIRLVIS